LSTVRRLVTNYGTVGRGCRGAWRVSARTVWKLCINHVVVFGTIVLVAHVGGPESGRCWSNLWLDSTVRKAMNLTPRAPPRIPRYQ